MSVEQFLHFLSAYSLMCMVAALVGYWCAHFFRGIGETFGAFLVAVINRPRFKKKGTRTYSIITSWRGYTLFRRDGAMTMPIQVFPEYSDAVHAGEIWLCPDRR